MTAWFEKLRLFLSDLKLFRKKHHNLFDLVVKVCGISELAEYFAILVKFVFIKTGQS